MSDSAKESFLHLFEEGDFEGAKAWLHRHPGLAAHDGYRVHPLIREANDRGNGHAPNQEIADLLTPAAVRSFRDAVLEDRIDLVRDQLGADPDLVSAEFIAGRGIAQAIHHWRSLSMAETLLDAGADVNALNSVHFCGETPLYMQVRFGTVQGVRLLLERGADPNLGRGHVMKSADMPVLIELLLEHGWDINNGPMLHDANHGHGNKVRLLLEHGADPNVTNNVGRTPLHLIASRGTGSEAIRALVRAGGDIHAKDNDGRTPLDLARLAKRQTAARELIALGADSGKRQ